MTSSSSGKDVSKSISILVKWAVSHGASLHPSVEVYQDAQTGLSFRVKPSALAVVQPYEPIVQLPTSLTLSYFNAVVPGQQRQQRQQKQKQKQKQHNSKSTSKSKSESESEPELEPEPEFASASASGPPENGLFPKEFLAKALPHVVGRLFLIHEYLKGEASFWWPYIQALPQPGHRDRHAWALAPFWDPEEAELLEGTNLEIGLHKIRDDVKRDLAEARELLCAWHCPQAMSLSKALTVDLYQWAYCIFSSRSFRPGLVLSETQQTMLPAGVATDDFSVLLPLFDIGNHEMTTEVRWELDNDEQQCTLKIGRAHHPGQQVFNNYSMKTNAELLLGYGFMIPATESLHNDYTHVRKRTTTEEQPKASDEYLISLRPLSHPSSVLARAKQSLQLDPSIKMLGSFQHVQAEMVWDIICTLTSPEQRRRLLPVPAGQDADRHHRHRFFSGRVEGEARLYLEQTMAIIQHKVMQELERLTETDVEVVGGHAAELTRNQKLALDYRGRCRKILEAALEAMGGDGMFD